jgi:hypothetical protein
MITLNDLAPVLSRVELVLVFRALPFALYVVGRPGTSISWRLSAAVAYVVLLAAAGPETAGVMAWSAVGYVYFALIVCFIHWLSKATRNVSGVDAWVLFGVLVVLFLAIPATLLRSISVGAFLVLGWELAMKGYSYVVEGGGAQSSLRESLFYFLVDPTIVFVQRARHTGPLQLNRRAGLRVAVGTLSVFFAFLVADPVLAMIAAWRPAWGESASAGPWFVIRGGAQLLGAYAKHSGVASMQLGLIAVCGHRAGERYNYPLLARSPIDFWRRWNTYIGNWAKRYIYLPTAIRAERGLRDSFFGRGAAPVAAACAVLLTFVALGIWHDGYTFLEQAYFSLRMTWFFVASACLILVSQTVAKLQPVRGGGNPAKLEGQRGLGRSTAERVLCTIAFLYLIGMLT